MKRPDPSRGEPITAKVYPQVDECVLDAVSLGPMTFGDLLVAGLGPYTSSISRPEIVIYWDDDESSRQTVRDSLLRLRERGLARLVGRRYEITAKGERRLRKLWRSRDRGGPRMHCPVCHSFVRVTAVDLKEGDQFLGWVGEDTRAPLWARQGSAPKPPRAKRKTRAITPHELHWGKRSG